MESFFQLGQWFAVSVKWETRLRWCRWSIGIECYLDTVIPRWIHRQLTSRSHGSEGQGFDGALIINGHAGAGKIGIDRIHDTEIYKPLKKLRLGKELNLIVRRVGDKCNRVGEEFFQRTGVNVGNIKGFPNDERLRASGNGKNELTRLIGLTELDRRTGRTELFVPGRFRLGFRLGLSHLIR
jgi:hypothetical protein